MTTTSPRSDRCPTCGAAPKRSREQNARYWALLERLAYWYRPEGVAYSPEAWHIWMKRRYLGRADVTLPDGKVWPRVASTTGLPVDEFGDYMTKVEAFAAENGVTMEEA